MSTKKKLSSILVWSVIPAAFIGPGTVTTCTNAGAVYGFSLLWTLTFSTFACLILQEASARITIFTGKSIGQAIFTHFEHRKSKTLVYILIVGAIVFGCAAYEAGNILGSVAGLSLLFDIPHYVMVSAIGIAVMASLSFRSMKTIAKLMGALVLTMCIAFFSTTISLKPDFGEVFKGSVIPFIPSQPGGIMLVLAIVGTTVVPYDLFLGSGALARKQTLSEMRIGLYTAIILGGIISMAVLGVGTIIEGNYSYENLSIALAKHLGNWAVYIFGFGMFAAGFTSAITAPLASALTAQSLFENKNPERWKTQAIYYRLTYIGVLLVGLFFGFLQIKPIPAIILAQALNGLILPFISIFLIFVVNNESIMGKEHVNGLFKNIMMSIVVWVTIIIGLTNIIKSTFSSLEIQIKNESLLLISISLFSFLLTFFILSKIFKRKPKLL